MPCKFKARRCAFPLAQSAIHWPAVRTCASRLEHCGINHAFEKPAGQAFWPLCTTTTPREAQEVPLHRGMRAAFRRLPPRYLPHPEGRPPSYKRKLMQINGTLGEGED
jgi:hypothetical protein